LWVSQEVHRCLFLYRNFCRSKNIKEHVSNQVMFVFEAWELPTMSCMLPKNVEARFTTHRANLILRK
jgi:hypothetical protein